MKSMLPALEWVDGYDARSLRADLIAGLTVALVLIPQSMAYAQLAGLPAYYGLYASFLPPMIAALFGSSRQLATGPVAVVSLMTYASLTPLAVPGSAVFVSYAVMLACVVGLFQFLLGVLRLGLVVNFLSHPVVNGFTNAVAIIIASSQLSKLFGVQVDNTGFHYETVWRVIAAAARYTHWPTLMLAALAFAIMYGLKRISPRVPSVLVAVVITTVISWGTGFQHKSTADVGVIRSERVDALIAEFNRAVTAIPALVEKRSQINQRAKAARTGGKVIEELDARHNAAVLTHDINQLTAIVQNTREALRGWLFAKEQTADGKAVFYPLDAVPSGRETDGRTWRILVGNSSLPPQAVPMTGGGEVVGAIPGGLPALSLPPIDLHIVLHLLPYAAIISLLGFMEAISIAKAMAGKTGQRLDPNQELIGQGLANIVGAFSKSYPVSGSFSRSAVNLQSGARTGFSSVVTGLTVVAVLLFLTPLLYHLPQSVLAAVIMMAVIGLVNVSGFVHSWRSQWYDGAISVITFICTLLFAPHLDRGIMVGVVLSLTVFFYKSMRPRVASLARYDDRSLRCATDYHLQECEHIAVIRFDGPLFFTNDSYLEDQITERMQAKKKLRHIILAADGINDIDASGEETLSLLVDLMRSAGLELSLSGVNESVMRVLKRTHLDKKIGEDHFYPTIDRAIEAVHAGAHRGGDEAVCPLTTVCRLA